MKAEASNKKLFNFEAAEISVRGIASGHLVDLSMHVKRYVKPLDEGKGPTRSTCTCANLLKGTGIFSGRM